MAPIKHIKEGSVLRFRPYLIPAKSVIKTLFPKKNILPYNDIDGYNKDINKLRTMLENKKLAKLLVKKFNDDLKIFGLKETLYGLIDFVCVKSLKYHFYPTGNYFKLESLPSKLKAAGWKTNKINRIMKMISPLKRDLDNYFAPISRKAKKLNEQIDSLKKEIEAEKGTASESQKKKLKEMQSKRIRLKEEREMILAESFRGSQVKVYGDILRNAGIISKHDKKKLAKVILKILYAQRNLKSTDTFGADIRRIYNKANNAFKTIPAKTASYFKIDNLDEYHPVIISLLGDAEILGFAQSMDSNSAQAKSFLLTRIMLLTKPEWSKIKGTTEQKQINGLIDSGHTYSTLYNKIGGQKEGIYVDAYKYAVKNGKNPAEIMTCFMMKHIKLVLEKRKNDRIFREATDKITKVLEPFIANINSPIIFYDTSLKGTFAALLGSLTELYHRRKKEDSIFNNKPRAFGFIYSIDEDFSLVFPHYTEGRNKARMIEDAWRLCTYKRDNSESGITLHRPAHNLLALICYHTFLRLEQVKQ